MKRLTIPRWMKRLFSVLNVENILVLPGPAFIVIPIGLGILATEYAWARRWLKKARQIAIDARQVASDVVSGSKRAGGGKSRM
jgi:hypothetical protein